MPTSVAGCPGVPSRPVEEAWRQAFALENISSRRARAAGASLLEPRCLSPPRIVSAEHGGRRDGVRRNQFTPPENCPPGQGTFAARSISCVLVDGRVSCRPHTRGFPGATANSRRRGWPRGERKSTTLYFALPANSATYGNAADTMIPPRPRRRPPAWPSPRALIKIFRAMAGVSRVYARIAATALRSGRDIAARADRTFRRRRIFPPEPARLIGTDWFNDQRRECLVRASVEFRRPGIIVARPASPTADFAERRMLLPPDDSHSEPVHERTSENRRPLRTTRIVSLACSVDRPIDAAPPSLILQHAVFRPEPFHDSDTDPTPQRPGTREMIGLSSNSNRAKVPKNPPGVRRVLL